MTLVAALSGHEGVVFFADTDETVADYSKKVIDKMSVWDLPDRPFRFGIAGTTTSGTYADLLQNEIAGGLSKVGTFDLKIIMDALTDTLTSFYAKHIWPRPGGDKPLIDFLLVLQPLPTGYPEVVHISETIPNVMGITTHWKSIGVGSYLADYLFNRILGGGEPIAQLLAAAVYTAKEVHQNIDDVGPLDRIVVFGRDGTYDELLPIDIQKIEENIAPIDEMMNSVFSDATDISDVARKMQESCDVPTICSVLASINTEQRQWYKEWQERRKRRKHLLEMHAQRIAMKKQA